MNFSKELGIIVLAAGKGTRMKQDLPKVLAKTCQRSLIDHVLTALQPLNPKKLVVVTGFQRELVEQEIISKNYQIKDLSFAFQGEQLGTGHAVKMALPEFENFQGPILIAYGDMPLIKTETFELLLTFHEENRNTISLLSLNNNYNHYGRIIRDEAGKPLRITEYRDCTPVQKAIRETNTGIYVVDSAFLRPAVESLTNCNTQREYYLTDIFERAVKEGQNVDCLQIDNHLEAQGVNDLYDLHNINLHLQQETIEGFIRKGVSIIRPETSYFGSEIDIEAGVTIGPNCQILGNTSIKSGTMIEGSSWIKDAEIGNNNKIKLGCRIENTKIENSCEVGPFAHLRSGSILESESKIGNFVETKEAIIREGAKASHLSYLGDCEVGEKANIGAGTITCNYDGKKKHKTKIGKNAFIGSNSALVAPVEIGESSLIGAGSVITKSIPNDCLALTRAELKIKNRKA